MNVYQIGVAIALTNNNLQSSLHVIARQMLGIHTQANQINQSFGRWALAIGGTAAIMGGGAMLGALGKLAERGSIINHQFELMKLQGMSVAETHEASARAMQVSGNVLTSTYADNLKHIRELRYAFGDTDDALKYLETVTKANSVLNSVKGGGKDQVWELVKSLEQKGLTAKPEEFMSYVDQMTKATVASGGKVTPAQFFAAFKYGRTAMLGWDETFVTQYLPRLIQSMSSGNGGGGGTGGPGNALMSAFAKVVQGQMPKKAAEMFAEYGLAQVSHIPGSSQSTVGAVKGAETFMKNPYEWVQSTLMPALQSKGINTPEKIIDVISRMFPVRTASQIVTEMALQGRTILGDLSPFEKDARLQREAFDQRMSYDELIKNDYKTIMMAFHAQWQSLTEVAGAPMTRPGSALNSVMARMTSFMNSASQFAEAHPEGLKMAIDILAALAGGLVVAGIVALAAAIAPLIGVGAILVGLAAGLATLAALNWDSLKRWWNAPWMSGSGETPGDAAKSLPNDSPGGAAFDRPAGPYRKRSNYIAPGGSGSAIQLSSVINLDGRRIAEVVTRHQVRDGAGPAQGAPYHDPTYSTNPLDLVLVG